MTGMEPCPQTEVFEKLRDIGVPMTKLPEMTPERLKLFRRMSEFDKKEWGSSALLDCLAHIDALLTGVTEGLMPPERMEELREVSRRNDERGMHNSINHEMLAYIDLLEKLARGDNRMSRA